VGGLIGLTIGTALHMVYNFVIAPKLGSPVGILGISGKGKAKKHKKLKDVAWSLYDRIFLWMGGVDTNAVKQVPKFEITKQSGYGTMVLAPVIMALFSMMYTVSTFAPNPLIYGTVGVFWAYIVFSFDRFVVSTFKKSGSTWKDVFSALFISRFVMAICIGIILSHSLIVLLLKTPIEERLMAKHQFKKEAIIEKYEAKESKYQKEINEIQKNIDQVNEKVSEWNTRVADEIDNAEGRSSGRGAGFGKAAQAKKALRDQYQTDLIRLIEERKGIERKQKEVSAQLKKELEEYEIENTSKPADFFKRLMTLNELAKENRQINNIQLFLILFFLIVDTIPLLFKAFTGSGPYDQVLREYQIISYRKSLERLSKINKKLTPEVIDELVLEYMEKVTMLELKKKIKDIETAGAEADAAAEQTLQEASEQKEEEGPIEDEKKRLDINSAAMNEVEAFLREVGLRGEVLGEVKGRIKVRRENSIAINGVADLEQIMKIKGVGPAKLARLKKMEGVISFEVENGSVIEGRLER
jgi:DNA uptake protein ComE-like DNA-binding protein